MTVPVFLPECLGLVFCIPCEKGRCERRETLSKENETGNDTWNAFFCVPLQGE